MFVDNLQQFTKNVREALDIDDRRRARLLRAWRKVRAERARLRAENDRLLEFAAAEIRLRRVMDDDNVRSLR